MKNTYLYLTTILDFKVCYIIHDYYQLNLEINSPNKLFGANKVSHEHKKVTTILSENEKHKLTRRNIKPSRLENSIY